MEKVAIIGAGPGGIAVARWLMSQGFAPHIFESHSGLGGQWDTSNPNSGIWPDMVTNTYLEATRFSDMAFPQGTPLFPHNTVVRDYFRTFAERFGVTEHIRFAHKVTELGRDTEGYILEIDTPDGQTTQRFARVVVASGRFNKPHIPNVPGDETFAGDAGICHAFDYKDPEVYRNKTVIVGGGSISSLEIASDLAMLGAKKVYLAQRRQRYVNPKMVSGVPVEYHLFTYRRAQMALENDQPALAQDDEAVVRHCAGDPSNFGAPKPHPDFAKAGVTGSAHYLNLVAEGRVNPVPWFSSIKGRAVTLENGQTLDADGILFGTGYALNLPFLSSDIQDTLNCRDAGLDLADFTFHPDLPGLAFVGFWLQGGSYPTVLEQQARYVAYSWGGAIPSRSEAELREAVSRGVATGHHVGYRRQNEMALRFARLCGTDPKALKDPQMQARLEKCAVTSTMFRLTGPDALPDSHAEFTAQHARFGPKEGD